MEERPDWHIDAKWIFGLLLIPVLAITLLLFNFYLLTNRENGIKFTSNAVSALYLPNANIEESEKAIREAIENSPDKSFAPFPDKSIKITEEDLEKYSSSELKDKIFTQLSTSIYDSPESTSKNVGLFAAFTKTGHAYLGKLLIIFSSISALFLALVIFFSANFGRLISPGLLLFIISLPGTLLFYLLQKTTAGQTAIPAGDAGWGERIKFLGSSLLPQLNLIYKNYLIILIAGIVLIIVGICGRLILKIIHHSKKSNVEVK